MHFQEGEFIPEVDMTDRELVLLPTKELNQRLREKMLSKDVQTRIKQRRRTLKNRFELYPKRMCHGTAYYGPFWPKASMKWESNNF